MANNFLSEAMMQKSLTEIWGVQKAKIAYLIASDDYAYDIETDSRQVTGHFPREWALESFDSFRARFLKERLSHLSKPGSIKHAASIQFTTQTHFLKAMCLELAHWIAPGEEMTQVDANTDLTILVDRIATNPSTTPAQMALIAHRLAEFIEAKP